MDEKQLLEALAKLKADLETSLTTKAKSETEAQIKVIEEKLNKAQTDATKDVPELRKELDLAKTELKTATDTIKVIKDAAEKNQTALDKLIAEGGHKKVKDEEKSFNTLLSEVITEKTKEIKEVVADRKPQHKLVLDLKAVGDMSFSSNFSTAAVSVSTLKPGIITLPRRKLHVRELLPGGSMSGSVFTFLREKTTGEGNPATVAEGAWKEQMDIDLEEINSTAQYIAGYLVCSTKMFDDVPGFISFLQNRLLEKLLRAEDVQLLYGAGTGSNLGGLTTAGNFTAASGAATIDEFQLIDGIAQLEMLDRDANGILVSPQDYYRLFQYVATDSGVFPYTRLSQVINGQLYIGGVPIFRSTAMITDKFLVGDWTNGAQIITREAPRVEIFFEDAYNVRRNQVTVRVEERIAFPVYGPDYFIYGDFGHS